MRERQAIRRLAEEARKQPPVSGNPQFQALKGARAGEPLAVMTPEGQPAFWIVPFVRRERACGYVQVELSGDVGQVGLFGVGDAASWIDSGYFREPPPKAIEEIRARHPGEPLSEPLFSYDHSPARWGWRIDGPTWMAFIGPGGWYERPAGERRGGDREG